MNDYDKEFLTVFNEYYPFERYILKNPKSIGNLFDDLLLTEIFVPKTEIEPISGKNGSIIMFTEINSDDIYVKVKGCAGEMRIGYFDFAEHIRENIRDTFKEDIGDHVYECLFTDHEDRSDLMKELELQQKLIVTKYGKCKIKEVPCYNK